MDLSGLLDLWRLAITTMAKVAGPFLLVGLAVGLTMSLLQAATQMQENILSLVPKLIAVGVVMLLGGNWLMAELSSFATTAITSMVDIGQKGGM